MRTPPSTDRATRWAPASAVFRAGLILSGAWWAGGGVRAQEAADLGGDPQRLVAPADAAALKAPAPGAPGAEKKEWVIAPIPNHSPAQGWGLALVGEYIFKAPDQAAEAPASIIGFGAFYTENKSYGAAAGYLGHWKNDTWRPTIGGGYAQINYDFYGIGEGAADRDRAVPIEQLVPFGFVQVLRRVVPHFYAGLRTWVMQTEIKVQLPEDSPVVIPPTDRTTQAQAGGPLVQWDSRDNQFYPTRGIYANASAILVGGDKQYQVYKADYNSYHSLGGDQVLALRGVLQATGGDAPFYGLASFGQTNDLRGYTAGKYRDRTMIVVQAEYRRQISRRWAGVVFAGTGEVAPALNELDADKLLSSAGLGVRFRIADSQPLNFRLDWAYGQDGSTIYLGVGEAF